MKDFGVLGALFFETKPDIKMGDTLAVLYLFHGDSSDPELERRGGRYEKTAHDPDYWKNIQDPVLAEKDRPGAKTVSKWQVEFLEDWKRRIVT